MAEKPKVNRTDVDVKSLTPEEQKAHYVNYSNAEATADFVKNVDQTKKNIMLPPLPKPGEIIKCQICGKEMPPEAFSKDPKVRKREFKWHIHEECMNQMFELADRATPGLIADRKLK